jgi:hypothetical protein
MMMFISFFLLPKRNGIMHYSGLFGMIIGLAGLGMGTVE